MSHWEGVRLQVCNLHHGILTRGKYLFHGQSVHAVQGDGYELGNACARLPSPVEHDALLRQLASGHPQRRQQP